jgi:hypothetical protein
VAKAKNALTDAQRADLDAHEGMSDRLNQWNEWSQYQPLDHMPNTEAALNSIGGPLGLMYSSQDLRGLRGEESRERVLNRLRETGSSKLQLRRRDYAPDWEKVSPEDAKKLGK